MKIKKTHKKRQRKKRAAKRMARCGKRTRKRKDDARWRANAPMRKARLIKARAESCTVERTPDLWERLHRKTESARWELQILFRAWATAHPESEALGNLPTGLWMNDTLRDAVVRSVVGSRVCSHRLLRFTRSRPCATGTIDFSKPEVFKVFAQWFPEHVVAQAASLVLRAEKLEPLLCAAGSDAAFKVVLQTKQARAREKELQRCKVMADVFFAMVKGFQFRVFGRLARVVGASKDKGVKVRFEDCLEGSGEAFFKLYFVGGAFEVRLRDERLDFTEKNAGFWHEVENFEPGLRSCVLNYLS